MSHKHERLLQLELQQPIRDLNCQRWRNIEVRLFVNAADFLAIALACESGFDATLFARWHVELMTLHVFDDVLLLHLAFETAERAFQRFSFADFNFCQA